MSRMSCDRVRYFLVGISDEITGVCAPPASSPDHRHPCNEGNDAYCHDQQNYEPDLDLQFHDSAEPFLVDGIIRSLVLGVLDESFRTACPVSIVHAHYFHALL